MHFIFPFGCLAMAERRPSTLPPPPPLQLPFLRSRREHTWIRVALKMHSILGAIRSDSDRDKNWREERRKRKPEKMFRSDGCGSYCCRYCCLVLQNVIFFFSFFLRFVVSFHALRCDYYEIHSISIFPCFFFLLLRLALSNIYRNNNNLVHCVIDCCRSPYTNYWILINK